MGAHSLQDDAPHNQARAAGGTGFFGDVFGMILWPIHRLIWADPARRARKLLEFAEVEASGGRDLVRFDVSRGFRNGRWLFAFDVNPDFWSVL